MVTLSEVLKNAAREKNRMIAGTDTTTRRQVYGALQELNRRLAARALQLWTDGRQPPAAIDIYSDFEQLLQKETLEAWQDAAGNSSDSHRTFHTLLGHYLQRQVFPFENELFSWMRGAAAHVNGEKIYLKDILAWCQKKSDVASRRLLVRETSSLCKFLRPFALGFWQYFLAILADDFNYPDYVSYCADKKGLDYHRLAQTVTAILAATADLYFDAMDHWCRSSLGEPLLELNRYDAIYLLGLGELDHLHPKDLPLESHLGFFRRWGFDLTRLPGLHLHLQPSPNKSSQAMSFAVEIPGEVHVVINPQGGWIDVETLLHELGHALATSQTSPELTPPQKDFYPSNALSEAYAFLLQNIALSEPYLDTVLGLRRGDIRRLRYHKVLRDLAVFRRYGAKFLAELNAFGSGDLESGKHYADLLRQHTGFAYLPESALFDLAPELYAADYLRSWMAEAVMERWLARTLGPEWMLTPAAGEIFRQWWRQGNRYDLEEFIQRHGLGPLDASPLIDRWHRELSTPPS